jgi:alpha-1,2-mannosyltransferase
VSVAPPPVASPPRARSAMAWQVTVLVLLTVAASVAHYTYRLRNHFFDLMIYRDAMRWWASGHPLYEYTQPNATQGQLGYTYPPFAAVVMRPLAWLTPTATIWIYTVIAIACYAAAVWWLLRPVARRHGWPLWFAYGLAVVLGTGLEPIRLSYDFGQINPLLWALIVFDLAVLARRQSRWLGVGIGLATAIKLVPGIFIVYLLVTRRWRAALVATGTAALASAVAAAIAPRLSWTFWTDTLLHGTGVGQVTYPMNQSLEGAITRIGLSGGAGRVAWLVLAAAVFGYGLFRAARAGRVGDDLTAMALTGFVGSLISPISWVHHLFWFVPAILALVDTAAGPIHPAARRADQLVPGGVLSGLCQRPALIGAAAFTYATVTFSMIQWWDFTLLRPGGVVGFLLSNWIVLLMLALLPVLPIRDRTSRRRVDVGRLALEAVPS